MFDVSAKWTFNIYLFPHDASPGTNSKHVYVKGINTVDLTHWGLEKKWRDKLQKTFSNAFS